MTATPAKVENGLRRVINGSSVTESVVWIPSQRDLYAVNPRYLARIPSTEVSTAPVTTSVDLNGEWLASVMADSLGISMGTVSGRRSILSEK